MNNIREHLFLYALLHDLWKFYHRAGVDIKDSILEPQYDKSLIALADSWSTGIDNSSKNKSSFKNGVIDQSIEKEGEKYLYSIFNRINNGKFTNTFPLKSLTLEENVCFPNQMIDNNDGDLKERYHKLLREFEEEFYDIYNTNFSSLTIETLTNSSETLLALLKKYTWCIPSNAIDMANVSLFEHLKTTAAFADCLYCYKEENPNDFLFDDNRLLIKEGVFPVMLVGGDLSGIQKYIYNIASRKAATSLKGRSFYLQLLIDSIIQRIINHPDIFASLAHVVYSSGGKFYMILPNTKRVIDALISIKKEFETELWDKHKGELVINIDYIPFAFSNNNEEIRIEGDRFKNIGGLWKCLADKLTSCKNKKFYNIISNRFEELFEPQKFDEKSKVCAVTGIESNDLKILDNKESEKTFVLNIVKKQAEIGNVLKDIDYIITTKSDKSIDSLKETAKYYVEIAQCHNYLLTAADFEKMHFNSLDSKCYIKRINNINSSECKVIGMNRSSGFQFYGGNKQAINYYQQRNKTFEELADESYLGVLRMDVDNLGAIFINGLPDEDKSFAAYSTLSFMLDYFFSGYLNTIRNHDNFKNDVNILYSGGDDVFAIGRWDKLILFAERIRKDFEKFVGRPDISISAGIVIVDSKFPIAKAAQQSGQAEDDAKKFENRNNELKNAINLFGETVSWKDEYDYVKKWKDEFVFYCNHENMSRSMLHHIMELGKIVINNRKSNEKDYSYMWNTAYFLSRFCDGKSDKIKYFCKQLSSNLLNLHDPRKYILITIAARWAELEMK